MKKRPAHRLLVIGWDAADWKLIDPLLDAGDMPNLKRLIDRGTRADLASLDPKLSPILWTTVATGKTADKHGVLNFIEADPSGSVRVASSLSRKTKAAWNILTQSGNRSVVINWYASHPAEQIRGICVSNVFQDGPPSKHDDEWPMAPDAVWPAEQRDAIRSSRVHPSSVTPADLAAIAPKLQSLGASDKRPALLARLVAQCRTVHNAALTALRASESWDCAMVFYDTIDVAGHHFMQHHPPRMKHVSQRDFEALSAVMNGVYKLHDRMLGELLEAAGDDTTVIILSDHGFFSDHLRPTSRTDPLDEHAAMDATWHRPFGMLVMSGPGIRAGATPTSPNLLDIAPTMLALLGLPIGSDMDGRPLLEAIEGVNNIERIESWDAASGDSGMHPAGTQIEPLDARETLKQLADLGYIQPLSDNTEKVLRDMERESRFNLSVIYMTTKRPRQALPHLEALHAEYPDDVRFVMNLAHCQQAAGDSDHAQQTIDTYLKRHPKASGPLAGEIHLLQAGLMASRGRFADAARILESIAQASPNDTARWTALADMRRLAADLPAAEKAIAKALHLDPKDAEALHTRALITLARGQYEAAAGSALDALDQRHAMPQAHYTLGVCLAWLGELEDARRSFTIALSQSPGLIDAHRYIAAISRALNDNTTADKHDHEAQQLLATAPPGATAAPTREDPFGPESWAKHRARSSA
ncbi:MAG: alkaline phosphatase family protein [Phycisphaerales bacterium]|nr:alkaline phosphatase family protein [Phycisphaerales bacterium]